MRNTRLAVFTAVEDHQRTPDGSLTQDKVVRNALYYASGTVIILSMIVSAAYAALSAWTDIDLCWWNRNNVTFWCEAAALWAFGLSWMVKGAVLGHRPEGDAPPRRGKVPDLISVARGAGSGRPCAMLSYQHAYHAGNLADVHKHGLLAWMLGYLTVKDKPLSYIETHAGRALYDLDDVAALKTGEAAQGIDKVARWFPPEHPFARVLTQVRATSGPRAYPGSPLIATHLLRHGDRIDLAELHPAEHAALDLAMSPYPASVHARDGFEMAFALTPPTPRRGIMLIDPSFEIKTDYTDIPRHIGKLAKAWNVGVIALWYPVLTTAPHLPMLAALADAHPDALRHEVRFPPARPGHGMIGSGLFVVNPPYGLSEEAKRLSALFAKL